MSQTAASIPLTPVGALLDTGGECLFRVWSPGAKSMDLIDSGGGRSSQMTGEGNGYWFRRERGIRHGFTYFYRIDGGKERPDPASQWQPEGIHGPSAVVDHGSYRWHDGGWKGIDPGGAIIYELHAGTFSSEGTFDGVKRRLGHLEELGVTALEIMPVGHFPGARNWGYDGVYPYAVHPAYGGIDGLKSLVDSCHGGGLAVILDVVYNHLGPEGNHLQDYGPYFTTDKYRTPWGWAVNYDDEFSDHVRSYFIRNALYWLETFHIDGLRLDAVHSIFDLSARHFLEDLAEEVKALGERSGRRRFLIAESDLNDPRIIGPPEKGGMGIDAQWSDDLHHAMHAVLTGERMGYYEDFESASHIARAFQYGYSYRGDYSRYRKRRYGARPDGLQSTAFVVCSQNHDQIGNRMYGRRLVSIAGAGAARLAAATVILSPMLPMLFMGEEWGETNPFLYFADFENPALREAVLEGRKREFEAFHREGTAPDPTDESTFISSKLDWTKPSAGRGARMLDYYRFLIALRRSNPVLGSLTFEGMLVSMYPEGGNALTVLRRKGREAVFSVFNYGPETLFSPFPFEGTWRLLVASGDRRWDGEGPDAPEVAGVRIEVPALTCRVYESTEGGRETT